MSFPKTRHEFEFTARMNLHYHDLREQRLSRYQSATTFVSVAFSSAAVASFTDLIPTVLILPGLGNNALPVFLSTTVAILNAGSLAFGISNGIRTHALLRRRWNGFLARATDKDVPLEVLRDEIISISADEPPAICRVLNIAYLETCRAMGLNSQEVPTST